MTPSSAGGFVRESRHEPNVKPDTRVGVAVLLSRFPAITETFILREVIEMERQGQPVRLIPLLRESPAIVHPEARPWVERALFTPFLSFPILAANARAMLHHPWRYATLVVRLVLGTLRSPRVCVGTIGIIPKSVYLAERARAEGIRHVHAHFATHPTTAALIMSAFADVSFSVTIHAHDLFSRKYRPLLRMKLERAAFVRVISRYNLEHMRALYPNAPLHKVHVIHVGIDAGGYGGSVPSDPACDSGPTRSQDEPESPLRLITVAALRDYKGIPVLLDACRRLLDDGIRFRCDVVGEGPMRPQLERKIRELDLHEHVTLLGAKPQHEVRRLLAERPIFVLSSVVLPDGWMEGIPVALMEAMASGAAVVTSRISGVPELVEHGVSGLLVEPGDSAALARSIRELAAAPDVARRLGMAGRAKVDAEFRLDDTVSALLGLIDAHNATVTSPVVRSAAGALRRYAHGAPVGVRAVHHGTDAIVAELVVPNGREPARQWVLKIHRDHPGASRSSAERARHECDVLASLRDGWGDVLDAGPVRRFGVPSLVHKSGAASLVMDACGGETLAAVLRASRASWDARRWSSALAAVRQSGEWLRGLQRRAPTVADADTAFAAWHAAVETDLIRCGNVVPGPLLFRAQASLHELVRSGVASSSIGVLHHGDFGPGNIFVGGRLQVIDFEGARPGLPYEDVAYFAIQLELFFGYPLLRERCRQAVSVFLEGYLGGEQLDRPAYRMARISKTLQILGRIGAARPPGLAARRRHAMLGRMVAEACA
jgi:glycosyltransferase involved in cell wall biosynthesis/aminoglycoside phosphotransferase (APT) family kinase protein